MNFKIEKDLKFLILMPYYNRPIEVKKALESISKQSYKNWVLAFIDDGSEIPGEETVKSVLSENELKKVVFYNTNETKQDKEIRKNEYSHLKGFDDKNAGCFLNPHFNKAMIENEYDVALFLCDDDMLYDKYLFNLNYFYINNPYVLYSYCNVVLYDDRNNNFIDSGTNEHRLTKKGLISGFFNLDTSQVSWRAEVQKKHNLYMNERYHIYFDAIWYDMLFKLFGLCTPNNTIGQYKKMDKEVWYDFERKIYNVKVK